MKELQKKKIRHEFIKYASLTEYLAHYEAMDWVLKEISDFFIKNDTDVNKISIEIENFTKINFSKIEEVKQKLNKLELYFSENLSEKHEKIYVEIIYFHKTFLGYKKILQLLPCDSCYADAIKSNFNDEDLFPCHIIKSLMKNFFDKNLLPDDLMEKLFINSVKGSLKITKTRYDELYKDVGFNEVETFFTLIGMRKTLGVELGDVRMGYPFSH